MSNFPIQNEKTTSRYDFIGWISLVISNFGVVSILVGLHPLLPFVAKPNVEP